MYYRVNMPQLQPNNSCMHVYVHSVDGIASALLQLKNMLVSS